MSAYADNRAAWLASPVCDTCGGRGYHGDPMAGPHATRSCWRCQGCGRILSPPVSTPTLAKPWPDDLSLALGVAS